MPDTTPPTATDVFVFRLTRDMTADLRNALAGAIALEDKDRAIMDYFATVLAAAFDNPESFTVTLAAQEENREP